MNYQEALTYLDELASFGIKPGLQRITRLTELLDLPQNKYHVVHVTGTNGKGSVSAMLASILQASSIRTGLFTSPHLVSYTERIQIDGQPIGEQDFADCLSTIQPYVEQMKSEGMESPTQFEVLTAMAFFYFALHQVEYAVIEVGIGGLLDSTNVVQPSVSVITNVDMEHAQWCGGTFEGIARHKAGIIKEGVPVVTSARGLALDVIRSRAEELSSDIFVEGEDFRVERIADEGDCQKIAFSSELLGISGETYEIRLLGIYQMENSAVARMTAALLRNLEERITPETIRQGLKSARWPARFEQMKLGNQRIILDGAHNPAGMTALRQSLDHYFPRGPRIFLLGILKDKDMDAMLDRLLRPDDIVIVTRPESSRAAAPEQLAEKVRCRTPHVESFEAFEKAADRAMELANSEFPLIIAGSLYLVGNVRRFLMERSETDG